MDGLRFGEVVAQHLFHGVSRHDDADPADLHAGDREASLADATHTRPIGF